MRFSTLLWDMDGTLFDTYPPIRRAVVDAFAAYGATVDLARVTRLLTRTMDECLEELGAEHGLDPAAVLDTLLGLTRHIPPEEQPPYPGVLALCRRVVEAGGRNLIFTHRGHESLAQFLAIYGAADLFADTLTADQGYPRKPDPAGFRALLERNGCDPAQTLAVGDRDLDMQAAMALGMPTCFFAPADFPGGVPRPTVTPDYLISSYDELAAILFDG